MACATEAMDLRMNPYLYPYLALLCMLIACQSASSGGPEDLERSEPRADVVDGGLEAIGDASEDASELPDRSEASLSEEGWTLDVGPASIVLRPLIRVDGNWHAAESCTPSADALECSIAAFGVVTLEPDALGFSLRFEATQALNLEAIGAQGALTLPGARGWLSNGFQSWSQSGVLALDEALSEEALITELLKRGDDEVLRDGLTHSYWHTLVGGGEVYAQIGVLSSETFKSWVQVYRADEGDLALRLMSGMTGERIALEPGESVLGERWFVAMGEDSEALGRAYGEALSSWRDVDPTPALAEAGWNSWYDLFSQVDEADIRANAALAAQILTPLLDASAPPLRITIDDGWQSAWGDWSVNEKFPSGLDGLASDLKLQGFEMGVWLAPLLVSVDAPIAKEHPEWLIEGALFPHPVEGDMRVLDVTHPEAAEHLRGLIETIVSWGYDFLKIDFLFAGTYEGTHHTPSTGMEHYHRAMALIREAAGEETVLLAVASPGVATGAYADGWRVGHDIAYEPLGANWAFIPNQLRSIAARWPLCLSVLCDADPVLLRGLPKEEVETGAWVVALSGGALFLSDNLPELDPERFVWGLDTERVTLALSGAPSIPLAPFELEPPSYLSAPMTDVFGSGQSTHVTPVLWRLQSGARLAINVSDKAIEVEGTTIPGRAARRLSD